MANRRRQSSSEIAAQYARTVPAPKQDPRLQRAPWRWQQRVPSAKPRPPKRPGNSFDLYLEKLVQNAEQLQPPTVRQKPVTPPSPLPPAEPTYEEAAAMPTPSERLQAVRTRCSCHPPARRIQRRTATGGGAPPDSACLPQDALTHRSRARSHVCDRLFAQVERRAAQLTAAMQQELTSAEDTGRSPDAVRSLSERELRCRIEALALAKMCLHLATPHVRPYPPLPLPSNHDIPAHQAAPA
jgi:hypothetical protein